MTAETFIGTSGTREAIGMIGFSKGGMETYLAAAVDPRIAVAVPCIGVQSFRWALDHGFERIIQMDADFSHSPGYISVMLDKSDACDVVVGSRYISGGSLDQEWEAGRVFLSAWANFYARGILRMQVHDATAGFKCWSRRALECIQLDAVKSNGYVFQVEMAYLAEKLGLTILEYPIYFEDRRIGQSKMTMRVKLEAAWRVWEVGMRHFRLTPAHRRTAA